MLVNNVDIQGRGGSQGFVPRERRPSGELDVSGGSRVLMVEELKWSLGNFSERWVSKVLRGHGVTMATRAK